MKNRLLALFLSYQTNCLTICIKILFYCFSFQESGDDDDDDDLGGFIVEVDETENFDLLEEIFRRDFDEHFNTNRTDTDEHIDDNDDDDDDDDDHSGSDFDDDVRFFLANSSDSSDESDYTML